MIYLKTKVDIPAGTAGGHDETLLAELHGDNIAYLGKVVQGKDQYLNFVA